jgi:RecA/RadA recombinase
MSKLKFDLSTIANDIKKEFKDNPRLSKKIGVGSDLRALTEKDFLIMPEWWQKATGVLGLPYGKIVMVAGDSDSGKTSCAISAMKAAQEQNVIIIYVETEGKTTPDDMRAWGVDPDGVLLIQSGVAEEAFELMFEAWDRIVKKYPNNPMLLIFDSLGNTVSMRDAEIDLTEQNSKPGGKGAFNRIAINKLVAKRDETNAAILFLNYTYDNIGSPGKTNAGGKAVNFFSSLTFQTTRKGWAEKQVKGEKVRIGAEVVWKLFKNHLAKGKDLKKEVTLRITADGIEYIG